jgi:D-amino peptidase
MKVFISVDMEGTSGLERLEEIFRGLPGFDRFRKLMAGDANAVIRGAIDAGATEIVLSDSHGYMCNIHPDDLAPNVQLKRGMRRQWCQMKALDPSFDVALLIGYHAKAGTPEAILSHTWITGFRDVRVNGESVPEPSLNSYLAGSFGVPVAMLSGDDYVIRQSESVLGDIEYAQVKKSTGFLSGDHLPLADSRRLLRETAARAVAGAKSRTPTQCELPVTIEVDLSPDPVNDAPLGARVDDNQRFIDTHGDHGELSDVDLVLATHSEVRSPKPGTVTFTSSDYQTAYATLHSVLLEIYERDIENLIDIVADPNEYSRPDLEDLVGGYPLTELEGVGSEARSSSSE